MRRIFSILLAALLLSPTLGPLVSLLQDGGSEAHLPACCRRLGKHHCLMGAQQHDGSNAPGYAAKREACPFAPAVVSFGYAAPFVAAEQLTDPALLRGVALVAVARARMRQPDKVTDPSRGPPSSFVV